jgi:hypothetical protein
MNPISDKRFTAILRVLLIACILFTLISLCVTPIAHHRHNSARWPTTTGTIAGARLKTASHKPGRPTRYSPFVFYTYTVADIPRASTRINFNPPDRLLKEEALALLNRNYPLGRTVTVYYDAANPDLAVLVPGSVDDVIHAWSAAATAALCAAVCFTLLRRKPLSSPALT